MKRFTVAAILSLVPAILPAADQPMDIKPGLWDIVTTTEMSGAPPIPNLDRMTPEQRARVESSMKNMMGKPHTATVKSCVTREGIDKAIARANSNERNRCSPKIASMTASKLALHMECSDSQGQMRSNGDITIERQDSEHIKGSGAIKTSTPNGHTMDTSWSMTGRFVSSDCGNMKPAGEK